MPRIITSASDPIDYCWFCFPSEKRAREVFGDVGDGPDDRGNCFEYRADHPPYSDDVYRCDGCGKELTEADDN